MDYSNIHLIQQLTLFDHYVIRNYTNSEPLQIDYDIFKLRLFYLDS